MVRLSSKFKKKRFVIGAYTYVQISNKREPILYSTQSISFGNGTEIIKISEYMGAIPKREPMLIICCQNTKFHTVPLYN